MSIGEIIANLIQMYTMVVLLWCLLSWFPNISRREPPYVYLDNIVRPVMEPFQRVIPPISGIDLSPMVAIILLQFVGDMARRLL